MAGTRRPGQGRARVFAPAFDRRRGGFGNAPKFPRPSELLFLLREHARTGAAEPRDMALVTLRAMALGGMRDHIGGGFHRYSVDGDWRVPHFEKMLYDQAQLVLAYVEAAQADGRPVLYADVAIDTLAYVRRDLTDPGGGFYSAEDADSIPPEHAGDPQPHKMEGAFYIWRRRGGAATSLGARCRAVLSRAIGVLPDGNAPSDPQNEFTGKNLLYTARPSRTWRRPPAAAWPRSAAALARGTRGCCSTARPRRPRPHLDDKVLTAWNGLMIAAFARAGPDRSEARSCVARRRRAPRAFLRTRTCGTPRPATLLRRYRNGTPAVDGYAEDYAYLTFGLLELFQADRRSGVARVGTRRCSERLDELFWDPAEGGWFSTTGDDPSVLLRLKETLRRRRAGSELGRGAEPAGAVAPDRRQRDDDAGRADARRRSAAHTRAGPCR